MANQKLLLLGNTWKTIGHGMDDMNRSLALEFKKFKNVQIYSTVLHREELSGEDVEDAKTNGVTLIYTEGSDVTYSSIDHKTEAFNQDPLAFLRNIEEIERVTHILAHYPYTAKAGLTLRQTLFPQAVVILMLHVIPDGLNWLADDLPYKCLQSEDLLAQVEEADYIFSITEKVFSHFKILFRSQSQKKIDIRLFIPQSPEELFGLNRTQDPDGPLTVLALTYDGQSYRHDGLDIAACAMNKVAEMIERQATTPFVLTFVVGICGDENTLPEVEIMVKHHITNPHVEVYYRRYNHMRDLMEDLESCSLAVFPTRCEPFGSPLIHAVSAGIPVLISNNSLLSTQLKKLQPEMASYEVPVTNNITAEHQDAATWRDHILETLGNLDAAREDAIQLRKILHSDEASKATHDDLKELVLGGIALHAQVVGVEPLIESSSLKYQQDIEHKLFLNLRHCARLKHHPFVKAEDLHYSLPNINQLNLANVTDQIESYKRRIISFDDKNRGLIVFCPSPEALSDLWATCDVINRTLEQILLADDTFLEGLGVKTATTRFFISGPEFLQYKRMLMERESNRDGIKGD